MRGAHAHLLEHEPTAAAQSLPAPLFNELPVLEAGLGRGMNLVAMMSEVGSSLADAEAKAHRVLSSSDAQRVRMFTQSAIDNLQHARELHSQVGDSVARFGIGQPIEEKEGMMPLPLLPPHRSRPRRPRHRRRRSTEFL
eukprot:TRINITY_DN36794_c0_g1_i1.p1 TRINITY_DN36794_c0_g1~~TRINITY_DN36794_c0_g1_i1.p1  ORF type:complete len:147 (+),score=31.68 TRINITY_DN36794_c0_g1_i1:26-442(+)